MKAKAAADLPEVHAVIERHHVWLKKFWTPNRESYTGLGMGYTGVEWPRRPAPFDSEHPKLATFMAQAMKKFAVEQLK